MAGRLFIAAALCPLAFAFSNTVPLLAWSSNPLVLIPGEYSYKTDQGIVRLRSSNTLDRLPSNAGHTVPLIESILYNDDVCDHDAVVIVEHPGVRYKHVLKLTFD